MKLPPKKQAAKTAAAAKSARVSKPAPARPRKRFTIRKRTVLIILAVCFVTIVGSALFARHQASVTSRAKQDQAYQADKARFAQVEADMQAAYDAMIAAAGIPAKTSQTKSCSHVSLKFEEGTLRCLIAYDFSYEIKDKPAAKKVTSTLLSALQKTFTIEGASQTADEFTSTTGSQDIITGLQDHRGMSCRIDTSFKAPSSSLVNQAGVVSYDFYCSAIPSGNSLIYPLAQ